MLIMVFGSFATEFAEQIALAIPGQDGKPRHDQDTRCSRFVAF